MKLLPILNNEMMIVSCELHDLLLDHISFMLTEIMEVHKRENLFSLVTSDFKIKG